MKQNCAACIYNNVQFSEFCDNIPHRHGLDVDCSEFRGEIKQRCVECSVLLDAEELFTFGDKCYQHQVEL